MSRLFRVAPDIRYRVIDDEAVVVRQGEGDVIVLNQVAARVLQLVGEGLNTEKIGDMAVDEYDAPETTIRKDVKNLLDELVDLNVLELVSAAETDS